MIWTLIHTVDILLWLLTIGSVLYVVFFALASLVSRKSCTPPPLATAPLRRFLVLVPAYHEDNVIRGTVEALTHQDYPQDHYDVAVISDHMQAETNHELSLLPITLLQPSFEKSSKAKALQYAVRQMSDCYDHIVILDADNIVAPTFLSCLNQACMQGYRAIQCHRTAKNNDNEIAALDGISEEINNSIFRRAHNNIGLSSALIGSGMCFDYKWFSENVDALNSAVEDRELEARLMQQNIYIKYEEHIYVMDEKVSSGDNFQRQRLRWMTGQIQTLLAMLPYLPTAVRKGNVNYIDKTFQQMLIPRSILIVCTSFMSLLMTVLAWPWSLKWWGMLACLCIALFIAIPRKLCTRAVFGHLTTLPSLTWRMISNLRHIDRNNKDFLHTEHHK